MLASEPAFGSESPKHIDALPSMSAGRMRPRASSLSCPSSRDGPNAQCASTYNISQFCGPQR